MLLLNAIFLLFCLATYVSAHGYLATVTINGQTYVGNAPNADPNPSIIRQVDDVGPVKGASNPYLNCGLDAQFAQQVASANPGDMFSFNWRGGDGSKWPHNTGPMLTYMTSCGSNSCSEYNSSSSKWFKIDQVGRKSPGGDWAQVDLFNGGVANVTLPSNLAPGNYIIRHEIIALHLATELGGAEFYPACTQLTVGGSQTGAPDDSDLVLLPGAYQDTDPGIYVPDVYDTSASYSFPGPAIASFISDSSSGSSTSSGPTPTSSAPSSSSSPTTGVCRLQRRISVPSTSLTARSEAMKAHKRKRIGMRDVLRDLIFGMKSKRAL